MRPLEILTPIILAVYIIWPLTGKKRPLAARLLPALAVALLIVHVFIEGARWQMIPLYVFAALTFLISLPALLKNKVDKKQPLKMQTVIAVILSLFLLAVSTALPVLLPVPAIPGASGPNPVGTQTFVLTDTSRRELYSGVDEPRKFMIQVWYPAAPRPSDRHAPWMQDATVYARGISNYFGLPPFFLDHLKLAQTPAWQDSPLKPPSNGGYPLILFSHGWNGFAAQNTEQALELASRGYIVVALQHTYGAVVTVFPDGEIAYNNPNALPDGMPEPGYTEAARKLVNQWSQDIAFALDYMTQQNTDSASPFYASMDLAHVGVYGHSTGGGAAVEFCGTDARCTALLGMDPFMTPVSQQVLDSGVTQPTFVMFSQRWADLTDSKNNRLFKEFYSHLDPSTHVIYIRGTSHYDFSDIPMLSPIAPQLGLKGPLNSKRVVEIVDDYLISFFDLTLKGQPTDLFDGPSKYPEVVNLH